MVYTDNNIKDNLSNPNPEFNENTAGNPENGKLDNGIITRVETLNVARILQLSYEFNYDSVVQRVSKTHNLGYRPQILGICRLRNRNNWRMIGDLPNVYVDTDGTVVINQGNLWIDDITKAEVTIGFYLPGGGSDTLDIKLYLLTNECP